MVDVLGITKFLDGLYHFSFAQQTFSYCFSLTKMGSFSSVWYHLYNSNWNKFSVSLFTSLVVINLVLAS